MTPILKLALIGHVFAGLVALIFYYAMIPNLIGKNPQLNFLKRLSLFGLVSLLVSWILAGYYYVTYYGQNVKPLIKSGQLPWAHSILMETKEHIFLFLPFLGLVLLASLLSIKSDITRDDNLRKALASLAFLIVALGTAVTIFGVVISGAAK
ncbi:hypothetical protein A3D81_01755 [Candidatus Curtissbacteria bacterium RIFCSPHIGHO2_02_FULL_40_17]|uniref:DUF4149 domain-containing protein n=2 Tax=Candidatus Curtissiibacteriota TaxID=1752717 RepID=A0A1F5GG65_9BACT|nr:MAG: hypothetical protein A3D81_01755 [Candidatus Curtissbacteria bacterium RIFCSPHIGHO2_02_FULL_40_17]OGE05059.1 MAG: hypothetical protein A3F45_02505 [Candidatus Curtissbacteria bacterium RIFCSPHIGHO2_12_FULL_41_17]